MTIPAAKPARLTPPRFRCFVAGKCQPQGSSRAFVVGGRAVVTSDNKSLKGWRQAMRLAFCEASAWPMDPVFTQAVCVSTEFVLPRLASHPKTERGKGAGPHVGKPDLDKLQRAVADSLTDAGVLSTDSLIVEIHTRKRYAALGEEPGVWVEVQEAT